MAKKVFISYAWEDENFLQAILEFSNITEEQSFGTCRENTYTLLLSWVNTTSPKAA